MSNKADKKPVVTRFPPEPSGHPHVGHLKAIYTSLKEAQKKKGTTILRFDDTNPSTSKQEYVDSIIKSLADYGLLEKFSNYKNPSFASDYFDDMFQYTETLIKQGDAYIDESTSVEIKQQRELFKQSPFRDISPEINLEKWVDFMAGKFPDYVVRLKINYKSSNASLRDPIIYRYNNEPHFRTGTKYCIYPTYDLACPITDSLDGVTLAMRTKEFTEKDGIATWIFEKLGLRSVEYRSYSRFNLEYSILSKRKIKDLIDNGTIEDWSDPRLDTLSAELRKGILVKTWDNYFSKHGSSKSDSVDEWDKIYSVNRKFIDDESIRIIALSQNVWQLLITDLPDDQNNVMKEIPWSPKDKLGKMGMAQIKLSNNLFIDDADVVDNTNTVFIKVGELVYLLNFRAIRITEINQELKIVKAICHNDAFEFKDIPWKISWLTNDEVTTLAPVKTTYYEYIITKPSVLKTEKVDDFLNTDSKKTSNLYLSYNQSVLKTGQIIQLVRFGFYIVDSIEPLNLIFIREPGDGLQYLFKCHPPVSS